MFRWILRSRPAAGDNDDDDDHANNSNSQSAPTPASESTSASVPAANTNPRAGTTHFGFPLPPNTAPPLVPKPVFIWRCYWCKTTNETIGCLIKLHRSWKYAKCPICLQEPWRSNAMLLEVVMRDVEDAIYENGVRIDHVPWSSVVGDGEEA